MALSQTAATKIGAWFQNTLAQPKDDGTVLGSPAASAPAPTTLPTGLLSAMQADARGATGTPDGGDPASRTSAVQGLTAVPAAPGAPPVNAVDTAPPATPPAPPVPPVVDAAPKPKGLLASGNDTTVVTKDEVVNPAARGATGPNITPTVPGPAAPAAPPAAPTSTPSGFLPPTGDPAMATRDIAAGQWWGMEFNGAGKGASPTFTITQPTQYEVVFGGDLGRGISATITGFGEVQGGQIITLQPGTYQALLDAQHAGGTSFMLNPVRGNWAGADTPTTPPAGTPPGTPPPGGTNPAARGDVDVTGGGGRVPSGSPTGNPLTPGGATGAPGALPGTGGVTTINPGDIATRTVDPGSETVEGRLTGLLSTNSDYIQGFRARTSRAANERGLLNSSMAASAGEEAAAAGALPIATADAAAYGHAADYNVAAQNQALLANMTAYNNMSVAQLESATQRSVAQTSASASQANAAIAAAASRYNADVSANASRYANDVTARTAADARAAATRDAATHDARMLEQQTQHDHIALVNSILNNADIPPERRAAMLRAMGENALADGIYVVSSTTPDLTTPPGGGGTAPDQGGG